MTINNIAYYLKLSIWLTELDGYSTFPESNHCLKDYLLSKTTDVQVNFKSLQIQNWFFFHKHFHGKCNLD